MRALLVHAGPTSGRRTQTVLAFSASLAVAVVAGLEVAKGDGTLPVPLLGLAALSGAVLLLHVPVPTLFLGWLLVAPLLQNSADSSAIGRPLALAAFAAPTVVFALYTVTRWRPRSDAGLLDLFPAAYAVYVLGSIAITTTLLQTDIFGIGKAFYLGPALGPLIYYFLVFGPGRSIASEAIVRVLLLATLVQALLAMVEWVSGGWGLWGTSPWHYSSPPRSVATLASPAALGAFVGCGIVTALAVLAWRGPVGLRRLSWLVLATGIPALLVSFTRAPIVATVLVALVVLLPSRNSRLVALGVVVATTVALVAVWPRLSATSVYQTRIADRTNIAGRADIQDVSFKAAAQKPLTGWGYGSFDTAKLAEGESVELRVQGVLATTSHNGFLTILVELGAVGLALLLTPWVVLVCKAIAAARRSPPDRWLLVAGTSAVGVIVLTTGANDLRFFSIVLALPWIFLGILRRRMAHGGEPFTS